MKHVTATIGKDHYLTNIINPSGHSLFADEPVTSGGKDAGFSPEEILASSLGACTCITLRMYADRKEWPIDNIEAIITIDRNVEKNETTITRNISFKGDIDEHQRKRLLDIANKCPIHQILTHPVHIHTSLV